MEASNALMPPGGDVSGKNVKRQHVDRIMILCDEQLNKCDAKSKYVIINDYGFCGKAAVDRQAIGPALC